MAKEGFNIMFDLESGVWIWIHVFLSDLKLDRQQSEDIPNIQIFFQHFNLMLTTGSWKSRQEKTMDGYLMNGGFDQRLFNIQILTLRCSTIVLQKNNMDIPVRSGSSQTPPRTGLSSFVEYTCTSSQGEYLYNE